MSVWEYSEFNAYTTKACVKFLIITCYSDEIKGKIPHQRKCVPCTTAVHELISKLFNYKTENLKVENDNIFFFFFLKTNKMRCNMK